MKAVTLFLFTAACAAVPPAREAPRDPECMSGEIVDYIDEKIIRYPPQERDAVEKVISTLRSQDADAINRLISSGMYEIFSDAERAFWFIMAVIASDYLSRQRCRDREELRYPNDDLLSLGDRIDIGCFPHESIPESARLYLLWRLDDGGKYACKP